jgi:queuine/archaeosine tRNA-ribosyltransferase
MMHLPGPTVWLGQSADTSSICSFHSELNHFPFLTSLGCAIRKPSLKRTHFNAHLKTKLGITGPLMVDSGGFALMMNPRSRWTIRDVSFFIKRIEADIFVSLDHPPAKSDSASERRRKIELSIRNFRVLSDRFPAKAIMPVVHGRTISEIDLSIQLIDQHLNQQSWIGLGGIVPLLQHRVVSREISRMTPEVFIALSLGKIRGAFPKAKIHAFGAGGTRTFPAVFAFGADSADSIGWRQAAGFGSIFLPMKSQRAVTWNGEKRPPRKVLDASDLIQIANCNCPVCRDHTIEKRIDAFRRHFYSRSIHNAWTIVHQGKFWPSSRHALICAISDGALGFNWAKAINSIR